MKPSLFLKNEINILVLILLALAPMRTILSAEDKKTIVALCGDQEKSVFSCKKNKRTFTLCVSENLSEKEGYLQYIVRKNNVIEFEFPAKNKHPKDFFNYSLINRMAQLEFENKGTKYTLRSFITGDTEIEVIEPNNKMTEFKCENQIDDDLTMTWVINMFEKAKIKN